MVATRGTIACFHAKWTFDERRAESTRILTKYPDRVPVIAVHGHTARCRTSTKVNTFVHLT